MLQASDVINLKLCVLSLWTDIMKEALICAVALLLCGMYLFTDD